MKNKKWIIFLSLLIVITIIGDIILVIINKNDENRDVFKNIHCQIKTERFNHEKGFVNGFDYTRKYNFFWFDDMITEATQIEEYKFETKTAYDAFKWESNIEAEIELDEKNLIKKYSFKAQLPTESKSLEQYLLELKEKGYLCE